MAARIERHLCGERETEKKGVNFYWIDNQTDNSRSFYKCVSSMMYKRKAAVPSKNDSRRLQILLITDPIAVRLMLGSIHPIIS